MPCFAPCTCRLCTERRCQTRLVSAAPAPSQQRHLAAPDRARAGRVTSGAVACVLAHGAAGHCCGAGLRGHLAHTCDAFARATAGRTCTTTVTQPSLCTTRASDNSHLFLTPARQTTRAGLSVCISCSAGPPWLPCPCVPLALTLDIYGSSMRHTCRSVAPPCTLPPLRRCKVLACGRHQLRPVPLQGRQPAVLHCRHIL